MSTPFFDFIEQSFLLVLLISGVPLIAGTATGLLIAILQAATQVQEQSISFLVKFLVIAGVFAVAGRWFFFRLVEFLQTMLGSIPFIGNG